MSNPTNPVLGSVATLWRYPVKSMMGEELNATAISGRGVAGDRGYALVDRADGRVASAKNPKKWPRLFEFRAALADAPTVRITLPDGTEVRSDAPDVDRILSTALQREVTLARAGGAPAGEGTGAARAAGTAEEYWPDMEGLEHRDTVTEFELPAGTFFDAAVIHVLTTATLDRLRALYPAGRFETRRFRPNVVVATPSGEAAFTENAWVGRTLALGDAVRLSITGPCPRCVMTTLAQADLPKDPGILRTAAQHNQANVGVYASVTRGGTVRRGDAVRLE
jgi:hypothetical protein